MPSNASVRGALTIGAARQDGNCGGVQAALVRLSGVIIVARRGGLEFGVR